MASYKDAGVDIEAGNGFAKRLVPLARATLRPEILSGIGGFAAVSRLPSGLREPLIVSSTDGVGTKLKVAFATGRHGTIGIDLVAMCVNDVITAGAEPLFLLDYFATSELNAETAETVVSGIAEGCRQAGCALIGGETAEMPGMYPPGEYDLAGFSVGVVERDRLIDGSRAVAGDMVLGIPSSGLHSNGYSLARCALGGHRFDDILPDIGRTLGEELLEPTRIYVDPVKRLLGGVDVLALAHITGGGLIDNPPRVVPGDLAFRLYTSSWSVPAIMSRIAFEGKVEPMEMMRTFNMGLGMLVVVSASDADKASRMLAPEGAHLVGELVPRRHEPVELVP
jgi:phosphoribosylformylglycinamidine cyclo-ligase